MKKFLIFLSASIFAALFVGCSGTGADAVQPKKARKIALHGYVYQDISLAETLKKASDMKVDGVVLTKRQFIGGKYPNARVDEKMTPEQRAYVKKLFSDFGLEIAGFGVYSIPVSQIDSHLDFCADMGIGVFTEENPRSDQKLWNAAAAKRGIKIALHHHGKKTNEYWNPETIAAVVSDYENIGVCADNGHWARESTDIVRGYRTVGDKIRILHFKDVSHFGTDKKTDTALGEGCLNLPEMLRTLDDMGFDGWFVLENESVFKNPTPAMEKSVKYLREH